MGNHKIITTIHNHVSKKNIPVEILMVNDKYTCLKITKWTQLSESAFTYDPSHTGCGFIRIAGFASSATDKHIRVCIGIL